MNNFELINRRKRQAARAVWWRINLVRKILVEVYQRYNLNVSLVRVLVAKGRGTVRKERRGGPLGWLSGGRRHLGCDDGAARGESNDNYQVRIPTVLSSSGGRLAAKSVSVVAEFQGQSDTACH